MLHAGTKEMYARKVASGKFSVSRAFDTNVWKFRQECFLHVRFPDR